PDHCGRGRPLSADSAVGGTAPFAPWRRRIRSPAGSTRGSSGAARATEGDHRGTGGVAEVTGEVSFAGAADSGDSSIAVCEDRQGSRPRGGDSRDAGRVEKMNLSVGAGFGRPHI